MADVISKVGAVPLAKHEQEEMEATLSEVRRAASATAQKRPRQIRAELYVPAADGTSPTNGSGRVVHFVRHGLGYHNVWGKNWSEAAKHGNPYVDEGCPVDAKLTPIGVFQAKDLQPRMAELLKSSVTPVVVSPLRRAIQTALCATEGLPVEMTANELLHEQAGLHICDRCSDHAVC